MPDLTSLPARVLVTGVDGVAGGNIALELSSVCEVHGLFEQYPVTVDGCETARWDAGSFNDLAAVVRDKAPQWVIHCGRMAESSWSPPDPSFDARREIAACDALARLSRAARFRLVVLSTDAVFVGPRMFHAESLPARGEGLLADTARCAEDLLQECGALVVRTHVYGWSPSGRRPGVVERIWRVLSESTPDAFDDEAHATPILASDLAGLLLEAYRRGLTGCYHLAGAERTSLYRFAAETAEAFGVSRRHMESSCCRRGIAETSLDCRRARSALQRPMPALADGLARLVRQTADGWRTKFRRAPVMKTFWQPVAA